MTQTNGTNQEKEAPERGTAQKTAELEETDSHVTEETPAMTVIIREMGGSVTTERRGLMIKETTGEALKTGIGGQAITKLMNQINVTGTQFTAETAGMSAAKTTAVKMSAVKTIAVETTVVETIVVKIWTEGI